LNANHFPLFARIGQEEDDLTRAELAKLGSAAFGAEDVKNIV